MPENQALRCRPCWSVLAIVFICAAGLALLALRFAYPFLAASDSGRGGSLVVDGWLPDYALTVAKDEFYKHPYDAVYTTGGPIEHGSYLLQFKSFAELGAAGLIAMGVPAAAIHAVPSPPATRGRTYSSATVLQQWLREHRVEAKLLTVMTQGPHARRTRMFYQKVFGTATSISVIAIDSVDYDGQHWWRSSAGFRAVVTEAIAYLLSLVLPMD